jgi:hypothetical protein
MMQLVSRLEKVKTHLDGKGVYQMGLRLEITRRITAF